MTAEFNLSKTRLYAAPTDFKIDGFPVGDFSMAANDEEGVVASIQCFLLENAVRLGAAPRTIQKEGYALNQWYDYLRVRGVQVFDADERHLRDFLIGGGQRAANIRSLDNRATATRTKTNLDKLRTIVRFYDFWENKRGQKLRSFRGVTLAEIDDALFDWPHRSASKARLNFSRPDATQAKRRIETPTLEESEKILTRVLDREDPNRAHTYYLIGRLALNSGSRAVGIAGLHVDKLLSGLRSEPEIRRIDDYGLVLKEHVRPEYRSKIITALEKMRHEKRSFVYCDVVNKGKDWITLPIPLDLCVELVDYICTTRQDMVQKRFIKNGMAPPTNVFLSYKNKALRQESISNFYNKIFKQEGIGGSLHRFRAAFCQELVRDIYLRERAINGRAWQVNNVLEFARNLLGHKDTQSLHYYLSEVLAHELLSGHPVMVTLEEDADYVRAIATHLNSEDSNEFRQALHKFLTERKIAPISDNGRKYALY